MPFFPLVLHRLSSNCSFGLAFLNAFTDNEFTMIFFFCKIKNKARMSKASSQSRLQGSGFFFFVCVYGDGTFDVIPE